MITTLIEQFLIAIQWFYPLCTLLEFIHNHTTEKNYQDITKRVKTGRCVCRGGGGGETGAGGRVQLKHTNNN